MTRMTTPHSPATKARRRRPAAVGITAMAVLMLTGCGAFKTQHVEVGAIPDDYRTRHPIIISEKEHAFDIPVASGDRTLTTAKRESVRGAADRYRQLSSGSLYIMTPVGSANAGAASYLRGEVIDVLSAEGIPRERMLTTTYATATADDAAPIRIAFLATSASAGPCGRWPEDMLSEPDENRNYENFGCSSQSNLAAQIANPGDLLGPRGMSPIDASRRATVIEGYREDGSGTIE
ncbi:CpaD family pilus assembly protein [Pseudohoeflea coraliihabitans]|nr:CpaD family pilus assembly lipoprotein [Pseudohoeflea sp. DP4N28-3]